jgi:hypothetical protein
MRVVKRLVVTICAAGVWIGPFEGQFGPDDRPAYLRLVASQFAKTGPVLPPDVVDAVHRDLKEPHTAQEWIRALKKDGVTTQASADCDARLRAEVRLGGFSETVRLSRGRRFHKLGEVMMPTDIMVIGTRGDGTLRVFYLPSAIVTCSDSSR